MGTTDLYTAEFPHGTLAGYTDGCRGKLSCPNAKSDEFTCVEVHGLYRTDYRFHKLVDLDPAKPMRRDWDDDQTPPPVEPSPPATDASDAADDDPPAVVVEPRPEEDPAPTPAAPDVTEFRHGDYPVAIVREWARANGIDVPAKGRFLPRDVVAKWRAAGAPLDAETTWIEDFISDVVAPAYDEAFTEASSIDELRRQLEAERTRRTKAEAALVQLREYADKLEHAGNALAAEIDTMLLELETLRANVAAAERTALEEIDTLEAQRDAALAEARHLRDAFAHQPTFPLTSIKHELAPRRWWSLHRDCTISITHGRDS